MDLAIANVVEKCVFQSFINYFSQSAASGSLLQMFLRNVFMHLYKFLLSWFLGTLYEGGSGYCKYGWSKYAAPSGRCATFVVKKSFAVLVKFVI